MAMMTQKQMDEWVNSLPIDKQDEACDIYSAKDEASQMAIVNKFSSSRADRAKVKAYQSKSPGSQAEVMAELDSVYTPQMGSEDLGGYMEALGLSSPDQSDSAYYANQAKFRDYTQDYQQRSIEQQIADERTKLAREMDENSFHLLSPKESAKKFIDSDDKFGYIQNSILNNLFPVLARRGQDEIMAGVGPTSWGEMDIGDKLALGADIGAATILAGAGKAIAGAARAIKGSAAKTTLQELMGAGIGGATGAVLQETAKDNLTTENPDFWDYSLSALLGATTNAMATPMLWKQAADLTKSLAKGTKNRLVKGVSESLEDLGTSAEARAGDYLAEQAGVPRDPTIGNVSTETKEQIQQLLSEANSKGRSRNVVQTRKDAQRVLNNAEIPMDLDPSLVGAGRVVTPQNVLEPKYTVEGATDANIAGWLAENTRNGKLYGNNSVLEDKGNTVVQGWFDRNPVLAKWYSVFDPRDNVFTRYGVKRELGSDIADLVGASPNNTWYSKDDLPTPTAEEAKQAEADRNVAEQKLRNDVMSRDISAQLDEIIAEHRRDWDAGFRPYSGMEMPESVRSTMLGQAYLKYLAQRQ